MKIKIFLSIIELIMDKKSFIEIMCDKYDEIHHENIQIYISNLDVKEYETLIIAHNHLESSFHLLKSVGYISFIESK